MDKVKGSLEALNAMQLTAGMEGLDAESKTLLHSKEVLAVILQGTVEEYEGYSRKEIMEFIEADSITGAKEVSAGRTNAQIQAIVRSLCSLGRRHPILMWHSGPGTRAFQELAW